MITFHTIGAVQQPDEEMMKLRYIRGNSQLKHIPVDVALKKFAAFTSKHEGSLNINDFHECYLELMKERNVAAPTRSTIEDVFGLFDKDSNGVVDLIEMIVSNQICYDFDLSDVALLLNHLTSFFVVTTSLLVSFFALASIFVFSLAIRSAVCPCCARERKKTKYMLCLKYSTIMVMDLFLWMKCSNSLRVYSRWC